MTAQRATDLRRQNLVRVLDVILREGAHSRAALAERLGLSRAALTAIVGDLITLGVLREGGQSRPRAAGHSRSSSPTPTGTPPWASTSASTGSNCSPSASTVPN
ncbi:hypothetical protein BW730_09880 [Tessaracoccus aquimaris]|uniref:HTH marR-type domain-containing protein n=1 Tax=Tessaracoccus aquimaris TaxID=1332264 RepID=A0A1Q2CNS0_9ACTN|nr:hypothetical protein BW730_09880 [Tessaracoccus aquimaris]